MKAKDELVEMVSTWGAVAHPRLSPLLAALEECQGPGRSCLQRALAQASDELSVETIAEIRRALDHGPRAALAPLLRRVEHELKQGVAERRQQLLERFQDVQQHLEPEGLERILHSVWQAEDDVSLDAALHANGSLAAAEHVLQHWLELARRELHELVENGHRRDLEPALVRQARAALESNKPVEIVTARDTLRRRAAETDATTLERTALEARRRLEEVLAEARALVERGELEGDAAILASLVSVIEGAEHALATHAPPDVSRAWTDQIGALVGGAMERGVAARAGRHRLAQRLGQELTRVLERHPSEDEALRAQQDEALNRRVRALEQAAIAGGPAFESEVEQGMVELRALRKETARAADAARAQLERAKGEVTQLLSRAAASLPTRLVLECRLRLEQVSSTEASGDPKLMRSLDAALRHDLETLRRTASDVQQTRRDRSEAFRERSTREIERFLPFAARGQEKRLSALRAQLASGRGDPERLGATLEATISSIERRLRLRTSRTLARANARLARRRGAAVPRLLELERSAARARQVLEGDELEAIAAAETALVADLRRAYVFARPGVRVTLVCGSLAAVLAAASAAWWWLGQPHEVELRFTGRTGGQGQLWLAGDTAFETLTTDLSQPRTVRLPSGQYEVYLDRKFTGVTFEVPSTEKTIEVPVP